MWAGVDFYDDSAATSLAHRRLRTYINTPQRRSLPSPRLYEFPSMVLDRSATSTCMALVQFRKGRHRSSSYSYLPPPRLIHRFPRDVTPRLWSSYIGASSCVFIMARMAASSLDLLISHNATSATYECLERSNSTQCGRHDARSFAIVELPAGSLQCVVKEN